MICSVHTRLCCPGFLRGAGRCLPSGPEPAQQPPPAAAFSLKHRAAGRGQQLQRCEQLWL